MVQWRTTRKIGSEDSVNCFGKWVRKSVTEVRIGNLYKNAVPCIMIRCHSTPRGVRLKAKGQSVYG